MRYGQTIFLLLICCIPLQLWGQANVVNELLSGNYFQVGVGYDLQRMDFAALNERLAGENLPALSENIHSLGFLTSRISGNWQLSLKTTQALPTKVESFTTEVIYRSQQYAVGAAYNLSKSDQFRLLPGIMGIVGRNILQITDKSQGQPDFQSLLQNPNREADLRNYTYLLEASLSLQYQFFKRTREKSLGPKTSWVPLIFTAGYRHQLGASNFRLHGQEVQGTPELALEGFFAALYIGLGNRLRSSNK